MVATMAVAVPAMMLVAVRPVVAVMTAVMTAIVTAVMTVMKQCPQRNKSHRRSYNIVTMVCAGRCTG